MASQRGDKMIRVSDKFAVLLKELALDERTSMKEVVHRLIKAAHSKAFP